MSTRKVLLLLVTVLMITMGLWGGALAQDDAGSDNGGLTEEVAANFVERFDAFFNTPDFDIVDEIFAEDFQAHLPLAPQLDLQGFKDYVASFYVPFPDIKQTTNKILISGDHLTIHVTYTGTSQGEFFGAAPNGEQWTMNGIGIFQFEDGMAVENWAVIDIGELFVQTGVVSMGGETDDTSATGGLTAEIAADFVPRFDAVVNEDTALARELFHEDFTAHLPFAQQMDREGWIAYADMFRASFPDIQQTTNFMFHSGDKLVVHVTYNATFSGQPFFGAEPNGAPVVMNGIGIFRFEDGQAIENFAVLDVGELFAQIGLVTPPAPAQ
jgi:predicted ester cyclase